MIQSYKFAVFVFRNESTLSGG